MKRLTAAAAVPRLTAFTEVSGSGTSSLVLDTLAAESQRHLHERFPAFDRNQPPHYGKPALDELRNLSPSVDQRPFGGKAHFAVGTATDLAPLLRLLFSRLGKPHASFSYVFSCNQPECMCPPPGASARSTTSTRTRC